MLLHIPYEVIIRTSYVETTSDRLSRTQYHGSNSFVGLLWNSVRQLLKMSWLASKIFWKSAQWQWYAAWLKMMDSILYVYISLTIQGMWMIYITFETGGPSFQMPPLERSPSVQPCSSVSWEQKYAAQDFCVYRRRTWDEFKRFLSVAHASQPVERAENLEYRNQLSGVCWGAVYCSIESICLNHPVCVNNGVIYNRLH